jgi:hypothetical protein
MENRAREREPEERSDDRGRQRIARDRVEWHLAELEHEDRGRDRATGGRDRQHRDQPHRDGIALEPSLEPRDEDEDRRYCGERQLEARLEQRIRAPAQKDSRAQQEEVPPVPCATAQPRERSKHSRNARAYHGRLPAHGHHVADDRGQRPDLPHNSRDAEQPREQQDAYHDVGDVLS